MTHCLDCPLGTFASEPGQSETCNSCSAGTFNRDEGQSACLVCSIGEFSNKSKSTHCQSCPFNSTTFQARSSGINDCICPNGTFGIPSSDSGCRACPPYRGMRCVANSTFPFVEAGFYRSFYDPSLVHSCFPSYACLEAGSNALTECSYGYTGKRCGKCSSNGFHRNLECISCPSLWVSWSIFALILVGFLLGYWFAVFGSSSDRIRFPLRTLLLAIQTFGVISRLQDGNTNADSLSSLFHL
jgi:hypothetical protein